MEPNYFPFTKNLCLTLKTSLWHVQNQSYNFTPWSRPWPPTALHPVLDLQINLRLLQMVPNDSSYPKTWGLSSKSSLYHAQNQSYNFTPWSCLWLHTAPPPCSWPSDCSQAHKNGPKWIPHTQKPGVRHHNQVSSIARSKVTIIWHPFSLGPAGGRFQGKVGKLQMAGTGSNLDQNEPNFLSVTHLIIYNHRQGMLHGYWQHDVLWLTLIVILQISVKMGKIMDFAHFPQNISVLV